MLELLLATYLMANEMKSTFSWNLCHDEIFRNQVSFEVSALDTIVLSIESTHLKITFVHGKMKTRNTTVPLKEVCSSVREAMDAGISQVTADINYINAQHFFTFPCGCKGDHPGLLQFAGETPLNLACRVTGRKFPLPKGHELWEIKRIEQEQVYVKVVRLTENHHSVLLKQLTKHAAAWRLIGTHLGFTQGELDNIEANALLMTNSPTSWLSKMLSELLQWAPEDSRGSSNFATLDDLKAALNEAGFGATACDLGV